MSLRVNAMWFRFLEIFFRSHAMWFRLHEILLRSNTILLRVNAMWFRLPTLSFHGNEILFRSHAMLLRGNVIVLRANAMLLRGNEIILRSNEIICSFHVPLRAPYKVMKKLLITFDVDGSCNVQFCGRNKDEPPSKPPMILYHRTFAKWEGTIPTVLNFDVCLLG